jgi:hypothetical protein
MIQIELTPTVGKKIKAAGLDEERFVREALSAYLEDITDSLKAKRVLQENKRWYTLQEIEQSLGLAD